MDVNANQPETKTFKETEGAGGLADSQSQKRKAQAQKNTMQKKIKDPVQARKYKVHGEIGQHAKHNNFKGALETFKEVVQEGLPLNLGLYNALLYVTTGGNDWECYTRGRVLPALKIEGTAGISDDSDRASTSKAELISATQAVWSHLKVSGVPPDSSTYVSLARIEAIKGDAAAALQWAHSCVEAGQPVTLRLYHPALVSYTLVGDAGKVLAIDKEITAQGREQLDLSEYEYGILIEAISQHGTWAQLASVFHRMSRELNQLNPATMKLIEDFFNSPKAVHAFSKAAIDEREAMATDYEAQAEVRRLKRLEEAEALRPEFEHRRKVATEKRARLMEKYGGGTTALSGGRNHPPHAMTSQMKSSDELAVGAFSTTRDLRAYDAYGSGAEVRRLLVNSKQGHSKEAANNLSSISSSSEEGEIRATDDEEEVSTLKGVTLHRDADTRTDLIMTAADHTRSSPRNESAAEDQMESGRDQMESGRVRMNTAHGGRSSRARSPRHTGSPSAISPPPSSPSTDLPGPASSIRMTSDREMDSASEHGQIRSVGEPSSSLYHGSVAVNEDGAQQRVQNGINYLGDASASCEQAVLPGRPWLRYGLANQWQTAAGVKVDGHGRVAEGVVGGGEVELGVVDLEEEEWCLFADAISQLAMSRELKEDFKYYMDWYDRNGPYDVLVDGANVAFYGQNWEGGGFCWPHVQSMMKLVNKEFPGKRVLLMLHKRRTKDPEARAPQVQEFLESLKATKSFYFTPQGSNDDWYWLYATVKAKQSGLLVSNDELRDHIWSLLRPKHFLKWKARHIAHYTFNSDGDDSKMPRLTRPPKYSQCIQELPDGTWMFPAEDGTWFCARPASAAAL